MKYRITLLPAVFFSLLFASCISNVTIPSPTPESTATSVPKPLPTATPQVTSIPFGSDILIDQMRLSVSGAIRPADGLVSAGDMFNTQPGAYQHYIFITVQATCEAAAEQACELKLYGFKLSHSDGSLVYPLWFLSGVEDILDTPELAGGTSVQGHIPFIIGIGDSGLSLRYDAIAGEIYLFALP
jgi:hypothetical protein